MGKSEQAPTSDGAGAGREGDTPARPGGKDDEATIRSPQADPGVFSGRQEGHTIPVAWLWKSPNFLNIEVWITREPAMGDRYRRPGEETLDLLSVAHTADPPHAYFTGNPSVPAQRVAFRNFVASWYADHAVPTIVATDLRMFLCERGGAAGTEPGLGLLQPGLFDVFQSNGPGGDATPVGWVWRKSSAANREVWFLKRSTTAIPFRRPGNAMPWTSLRIAEIDGVDPGTFADTADVRAWIGTHRGVVSADLDEEDLRIRLG